MGHLSNLLPASYDSGLTARPAPQAQVVLHVPEPRRSLFGSQAELPLTPHRAKIKINQQEYQRKEDEMLR
jgi:hypothetical protein